MKNAIGNAKKILIVNTVSSERKLVGMVMWGAWAVASYLKQAIDDSDVKFLDENNEDNFREKFDEIVKDREVVGFSITSMQIKYTLPLVKFLREKYPKIKIMVGGIHVILFPNQDYGNYFDKVVTSVIPKNFFSYDLLPEKVKDVYRKKRGQVLTGFNCSYKCTFCINSVMNAKYEGLPLEQIKKDLDYVIKEFHPPKIYFRDEDFFQDINKAKAIVDYILEKGHKFNWETTCRTTHFMPGRVDDDLLKKMAKAGCVQLRFGIETGSQKMLNFLKKGQTVEKIKHAVRKCSEYKIDANCSMMIGIPTETKEDREQTYKLIEELNSYGKYVSIFGPQLYRPYPGGLLYDEIIKMGYKLPARFDDWAVYYDTNPLGDIFDAGEMDTGYPWLTKKENKTLPYVWVVVHYGLNYLKSDQVLKRLIGYWFWLHWKLRWFDAPGVKWAMFFRKKLFRVDLQEQ